MSEKSLTPPCTPELSRPLRIDRIPLGGVEERIVATPDERAALAKRFDLLALPRLEGRLEVDRAEGQTLTVRGNLSAEVVQACVVTLEPISAQIDEPLDVLFAPAHMIKAERDGGVVEWGEADPPEPIIGGAIDLGEVLAQHLASALNPYPRKEGALWPPSESASRLAPDKESAPKNTPFAFLAKKKDGT